MAGFGAMLAWYGGIAAASFGTRMLISVDLPMGLFRWAMPVGGALIALISVTRLAGLLSGQVDPDDLLPESDA
jgi:TRAP-type transport system small permease protein